MAPAFPERDHFAHRTLPIDVLAVIDGDDKDQESMMLDAVDETVVASTVLTVASPLALEKLTKVWIRRKPVNGLGHLLAKLAVGADEIVELLLGEFRENNRKNRRRPK